MLFHNRVMIIEFSLCHFLMSFESFDKICNLPFALRYTFTALWCCHHCNSYSLHLFFSVGMLSGFLDPYQKQPLPLFLVTIVLQVPHYKIYYSLSSLLSCFFVWLVLAFTCDVAAQPPTPAPPPLPSPLFFPVSDFIYLLIIQNCFIGPVYKIQFKFRRLEIPPNYNIDHLGMYHFMKT